MSIFGARIPRELKLLPTALNKVDQTSYRSILKYVLTALEGGVNRRSVEDILKDSNIDSDIVTVVVAGLFCLLRALFRADAGNIKTETLQNELQELRLQPEVIADILKIINNQRSQTLHNAKFKAIQFPTVEKFNWRVDVSISTSSLCRVLEPTILCEMILSNGDIKHFEMPMKLFHKLRCQVATVLKEIHHIEQKDLA